MDNREQFINETPASEDKRDWKERLLKPETGSSLRVDLMFVGAQSVADVISGHLTDADIDPKIIESYKLQYPNLAHETSFVNEVQGLAGDSERLRGFLSGVRGKLFELEYSDYLNHGNLPSGYIAELCASPTQPGVDILIKDSQGQIQEELQAKACQTLSGVKEHLERYPEITPVIIPHDQIGLANVAGLGEFVEGSPTTGDQLNQMVKHALAQSTANSGIHLPLIGYSLMAGEVAYLLWKGKPVSHGKLVKRGAKMTVASVAGQVTTILAHSPCIGISMAVMTRILLDRYTKAVEFTHWLETKRKWASS